MPSPQKPESGDHITIGNIQGHHNTIAVGRGARASNVSSSGRDAPGGQRPEPQEPWWRRLSPTRLAVGLVLAIATFVVSLWLYPAEWGESWRTVVALAIAAVVGVTLFLDAARNAFSH